MHNAVGLKIGNNVSIEELAMGLDHEFRALGFERMSETVVSGRMQLVYVSGIGQKIYTAYVKTGERKIMATDGQRTEFFDALLGFDNMSEAYRCRLVRALLDPIRVPSR
jgi:hypothetical protein